MKRFLLLLLCFFFCTISPYAEEIELESDYAYLIDAQDGQVLYDKGSAELIYPASMTKMMALIVALEHIEDQNILLTLDSEVFQGLYEANASLAGFSYNETVSIKDCLYGLFLPSGAECTRALAIYTAGSEEQFVELMNQKAQELGMTNTHFVNTTGLHHKDHVTTLYDLSLLLNYCIQNPDFYEIFTTKEYIATSGSKHKELKMNSTLFKKINHEDAELILGGKTGYTNPAGLCLASIASQDGRTLMMISAHAPVSSTPYHIYDALHAYRYFFETTHKIEISSIDKAMAETEVLFTYPEQIVQLYPENSIQYTLPADVSTEDLTYEIVLNETIQAPLNEYDNLGMMYIYYESELIGSTSLETRVISELSKWSVFVYHAANFIEAYWKTGVMVLSSLIVLVLWIKFKLKRKRAH